MINIYPAKNGIAKPPISIINSTSGGGSVVAVNINTSPLAASAAKIILSGALTANVLKTVLALSGSGEINLLCVAIGVTTGHTIRAKLTIDGVVVYDATTSSITTAFYGHWLVGFGSRESAYTCLDSVPFNKSLVFEIAESATATNNVSVYTMYKMT